MLAEMPSSSVQALNPVQLAYALREVPSAPHILSHLSNLLQTGQVSLGELGRIVRLDPGLAIRVLRTAYGSADKPIGPFFTIEDAINRVGCSRLTEMVRTVTRSQVLDLPLGVYGLNTEEYWRASVSCAVAAELLAERTGESRDTAYIAGLLHNVGMLAVEAWAREEESCLAFACREWPREYSAGEGAVLGFTHAEVGAALLSAWNFPMTVREPVRFQYVPLRYGMQARMSCLLHTAKWLSAAVCTEEGAPRFPDNRYLDVLRLTSYELACMVVEVRVRMGEVRNVVGAIAA
jgi:HD-like signal output (HDOD) protein